MNWQNQTSPVSNPWQHKILGLLASPSAQNIELALQILSGQSQAEGLMSTVLGLALFHPQAPLRKQAARFLQQQAPEPWKKTHQHYKKNPLITKSEMHQFLHEVRQISFIDLKALMPIVLQYRRSGVFFCLEHKILPPLQVLEIIGQAQWLSLENLELTHLPEEIGQLTDLRSLNISGNLFRQVPDSLAQLQNLEQLYYHRTPLSGSALRKLQGFFPKIFADKFFMEAIGFFEERNYQEALHKINKSIQFFPGAANAWGTKGSIFQKLGFFRESIACYEQALSIRADDPALWTNLAQSYLAQNQAEAALHACQQGLQLTLVPPLASQKWLDVLYLYQGQAFFALGQKEAALQSYETALRHNPASGTVWFHKARLYTITPHSELIWSSLAEAIRINRRFWHEAQKDPLLAPHWPQAPQGLLAPRR
ncbi:MAG: tetratricopeptide repeat protein [Microscillaceae bacterium]|nr:tetratricopeptide repeat protein [Microscillaceae bacterium]